MASSTNTTSADLPKSLVAFRQIFPILIFVFGAIGNTLTVLVLRKKAYTGISTCYYMKALAISDNFVMVMLLFRWIDNLPGDTIVHGDMFCKLYFFFVRLGFSTSAWCIMAITIDRFIVVRYPFRAKILCSIYRTRITLVAIVSIHVITHLPYFWRYADTNAVTLSGRCPYDLPKDFSTVYQMLRIILVDRLLPWVVTLAFTVVTTVYIYRGNKKSTKDLRANRKEKTSIRRVTSMSLSVAWVFFILTFPTSIFETIRILSNESSVTLFLYELFVYFLYLNSAINFYLYLIVSYKFRDDFKRSVVRCFTF